MYANFYHNNKCLYSIEVNTVKEAEHLADKEYASNSKVNDWTISYDRPIKKIILDNKG